MQLCRGALAGQSNSFIMLSKQIPEEPYLSSFLFQRTNPIYNQVINPSKPSSHIRDRQQPLTGKSKRSKDGILFKRREGLASDRFNKIVTQ